MRFYSLFSIRFYFLLIVQWELTAHRIDNETAERIGDISILFFAGISMERCTRSSVFFRATEVERGGIVPRNFEVFRISIF